MELPPYFEYFEKGTTNIFEKIIKEQGTYYVICFQN